MLNSGFLVKGKIMEKLFLSLYIIRLTWHIQYVNKAPFAGLPDRGVFSFFRQNKRPFTLLYLCIDFAGPVSPGGRKMFEES